MNQSARVTRDRARFANAGREIRNSDKKWSMASAGARISAIASSTEALTLSPHRDRGQKLFSLGVLARGRRPIETALDPFRGGSRNRDCNAASFAPGVAARAIHARRAYLASSRLTAAGRQMIQNTGGNWFGRDRAATGELSRYNSDPPADLRPV